MGSPSYISRRDEALYQAYLRALERKDITSHEEAVRAAVKSPTERFWVSPFQAYRDVLERERGHSEFKRDTRCRMMDQIYGHYLEMRRMPSFRGSSTFFIVQFAVMRRAPEFYISYHRAYNIIKQMRNEHRSKRDGR